MDAEEAQPTRPTPLPDGPVGRVDAASEEEWPTAPLVLTPRPLPDVVFGTPSPPPAPPIPPVGVGEHAGPGEITGPQSAVRLGDPQPVARAARGRRAAVVAAVVLVGVLVVGLVAVALWPSSPDRRVRQSGPEIAAAQPGRTPEPGAGEPAATGERREPVPGPSSGAPQGTGQTEAGADGQETPGAQESPAAAPPSEPPVTGSTSEGVQVTYRTVEVAAGYFEGELTLTNGTGAALEAWTVSFTYPGAVIRNVWGGLLGDEQSGTVTITGDENTAPVAAGGSVTVRFGGAGLPSRPRSCLLNGLSCGF